MIKTRVSGSTVDVGGVYVKVAGVWKVVSTGGPGPVGGYNDATGGVVTTYEKDGKTYRVHSFSSKDALVVKKAVNPFDVLVCGGGGGSGNNASSATNGGGGAGGLITKRVPLDITTYDVTVGLGGGPGGNGGGSSFGTLVGVSGGGTGGGDPTNDPTSTVPWPGGSGGSGGGSGGGNDTGKPAGGSGISGQGFAGGSGCYGGPGGGGGAGGPGQDGTDRYDPDGCSKGTGGPGVTTTLVTGEPQIIAAGGRATVVSVWGGGAGGGCGGSQQSGQNGLVVVSYEIATLVPITVLHTGLGEFTITNKSDMYVYSIDSDVGTASITGDVVKMSNPNSTGTLTARYVGTEQKVQKTLTRMAYTYYQGQPQCTKITFNCVGDCGPMGCDCNSQGCGCSCTYYKDGECAGLYGYQTCNCSGCPQIKNATPPGFVDQFGEWVKIV